MKMNNRRRGWGFLLILPLIVPGLLQAREAERMREEHPPSGSVSPADASAGRMREDQTHVRRWNAFAEALLALHQRQLEGRDVREESRIGGYADQPKFYREVRYLDAHMGHLLSVVQWERENPRRLHSIEVYVRDDQGRVVRDYVAAFLPYYRNAPVQALINLHAWGAGLHAFRQFDAGGGRIDEFCEGEHAGRPVQIRLFEDDLYSNEAWVDEVMASPDYLACFASLPMEPGEYLQPH